MKEIIKLDFYDEFKCSADKCPFTCCQEWKISVDRKTRQTWKQYEYENRNLDSYVTKKDGTDVIRLNESKVCPFLSDDKLCNLVIEHGDNILSNTCRTFPRQTHRFYDRTEYTLVACCPEVVDMLYKSSSVKLISSDNVSSVFNGSNKASLRDIRDGLINVVQNDKYTIEKLLLVAYDIVLGIYKSEGITKDELEKAFSDDNINMLVEALDLDNWNNSDTLRENNELFLDVAANYKSEGLYKSRLDKLIEYTEQIHEDISRFYDVFEDYDSMFKKYVALDIYTNVLMPDFNLESMVIMLEWLAIEYTCIRHSILLTWIGTGEKLIDYKTVRDNIVLISRMTGYDYDDIYDYIEECFQSVIWNPGYMMLIMGNRI